MTSTQGRNNMAGTSAGVPVRLEVVIIPVADPERAKSFFQGLGWRFDSELFEDDGYRLIHMTPTGSNASIIFGSGVTAAQPGTLDGLLLAVDDIETARPALDKAVALAEGSGGTIRLIYVRSLVPISYMEFVPPHFDAEQQAHAEKRLAELMQGIRLPKERVSSVVTLGGVYHDVLQEAEKMGADLVVVGSHRPTMATYLLGSNAASIVRHAKCSVLVVR